MSVEVHHGDCLTILPTLPDASIDAVVTDPPYGLGFMGKAWDDLPPGVDWARECLRVLKPGGHLLAFGGTRTWHRLACAVEDAGFELRDSIAWLYGSGFPKSLDVSKAIDKAAGAEREVVGPSPYATRRTAGDFGLVNDDGWEPSPQSITAPATDAARTWQGWGTALKPAFEPVVVARKPLDGTVAQTVLAHGTGALNIDATRIHMSDEDAEFIRKTARPNSAGQAHTGDVMNRPAAPTVNVHAGGRWPANVVLDEQTARVLDEQSGELSSGGPSKRDYDYSGPRGNQIYGAMDKATVKGHPGEGGASRFFYVAKAPKKERPKVNGVVHPCVKPLTLMRHLVRLVTPPGGTVLDTFAGSGTTAEACLLEGFSCVAIEREADYLPHIRHRVTRAREALGLFALQEEELA